MLTNFRHDETCEAILGVLKEMNSDSEDYEAILRLFASLSDVWVSSIESYMRRDEQYLLPLIKACKIAGIKLKEPLLLDVYLTSPVDVKREIITGIPGICQANCCSIIREAIKDTDGHIKGYAVNVVGMLSLYELKDEIIDITQHDFTDVRIKAIKALVSLDKERAMELIKHFVYDGSSEDKKVYLAATSLINSENNFPFIEKLVFDPDESVRRSTIGVIGNFIENERYVGLLQKILKDDNIPHEALKVIKDKKLDIFKDRLVEIFIDRSKGMWTRYYALAALGVFEDRSLFNIFVNGLNDENGLIIIGCIRALADLNDKKAMSYILPFTDNPNEDVKSTAESVLEKFERT
jgi:HEAT repeat protein